MDTPQTTSSQKSIEEFQDEVYPVIEDLEALTRTLKSLTYAMEDVPELALIVPAMAKEITASTKDLRRKLEILSNCHHHRNPLPKTTVYIPRSSAYIRRVV